MDEILPQCYKIISLLVLHSNCITYIHTFLQMSNFRYKTIVLDNICDYDLGFGIF